MRSWFVLLNLPQQVYEMMPIGVLIGALLGLGSLARGSELTVMRAAGISVWRIAGSVAMAGVLLMFLAVICGEFLAPPLQAMAKQQKALSKFSTITFAEPRRPVGARRQPADQCDRSSPAGGEFGGMRIFELTDDHELKSVATARTASVQADGSWKLSHYASTTFRRRAHRIASTRTAVSSSPPWAAISSGSRCRTPRQLETRVLWGLIRHLKQNDLDSSQQEFAFWSRIARTTAILFAALLAVPFVFGSLRSAGSGARTLLGVLIGVTFFLVQRMLESGALVFDASPLVLAWFPTVLLGSAALILIARTR